MATNNSTAMQIASAEAAYGFPAVEEYMLMAPPGELTTQRSEAILRRKIKMMDRQLSKWIQQGEDFLDMFSSSGPRLTMKTGIFSERIYAEGSINPQHGAPITRLPLEVTVNVLKALPHRADQIMLALTCKRFTAIDVLHRAQVLERNKNGGVKRYSKIYKLDIMIRLKTWMPSTLHLCYVCLKYKQRNKAGWETNMEISKGKSASQKAINEGPKCPRCAEWFALQKGNNLTQFAALQARIRKVVKRT